MTNEGRKRMDGFTQSARRHRGERGSVPSRESRTLDEKQCSRKVHERSKGRVHGQGGHNHSQPLSCISGSSPL